jgi:hypothetical protein
MGLNFKKINMFPLNYKILFTALIVSSFLCSNVATYATSSGRNTAKDNHMGVIYVKKATKLAAKSYAIRRYGRNIKILSNRLSKNVLLKNSRMGKYICRRVVLKTKRGDRKTMKICSNKV